MAKFSLSALALFAAISSTNAFAPSHNTINVHSVSKSTTTTTTTTTSLYDATVESPLAPLTVWGPKIDNIGSVQEQYKSSTSKPDFAPTISAKALGIENDKDAQLQYVKENAFQIKELMVENGAVIFRDFELMKEQDGFVKFYETLGMKTCLDPLHSVSARPTVDGKKGSPVYEAVNKESRKNFFIGE
jgi:hypothetical protein